VATEHVAAEDEAIRDSTARKKALKQLPEHGESDELPTSSAVADEIVTKFET